MESLSQRDITKLANETGCHWHTVYRWYRNPDKASPAVAYALEAAMVKLGLEGGGGGNGVR